MPLLWRVTRRDDPTCHRSPALQADDVATLGTVALGPWPTVQASGRGTTVAARTSIRWCAMSA